MNKDVQWINCFSLLFKWVMHAVKCFEYKEFKQLLLCFCKGRVESDFVTTIYQGPSSQGVVMGGRGLAPKIVDP